LKETDPFNSPSLVHNFVRKKKEEKKRRKGGRREQKQGPILPDLGFSQR
jgi:hypothetical protein